MTAVLGITDFLVRQKSIYAGTWLHEALDGYSMFLGSLPAFGRVNRLRGPFYAARPESCSSRIPLGRRMP